eukprot:1260024-Rhodomonas_salina.1
MIGYIGTEKRVAPYPISDKATAQHVRSSSEQQRHLQACRPLKPRKSARATKSRQPTVASEEPHR